jgi:2-methylcitrate dehydratase
MFQVAYNIIGGGEERDKTTVSTKEKADPSLPYMAAATLLDGEALPAQYEPARIGNDDVQALLRRVEVRPNDAYSARFPDEMPTSVTIRLKNGRSFRIDKTDYEGGRIVSYKS